MRASELPASITWHRWRGNTTGIVLLAPDGRRGLYLNFDMSRRPQVERERYFEPDWIRGSMAMKFDRSQPGPNGIPDGHWRDDYGFGRHEVWTDDLIADELARQCFAARRDI